jgi:hypothetical protein
MDTEIANIMSIHAKIRRILVLVSFSISILLSQLALQEADSASMPTAAEHASGCERFYLARKPVWLASFAYVSALDQLIFVDPLRNELLRYSPQGSFIDALPDTRFDQTGRFLPVSLEGSSQSGFVLQLVDGRAIYFDSQLAPRTEIDLRAPTQGEHFRLSSLYSNFAVFRNSIVGYGAVRPPSDQRPLGGTPGVDFTLGFLQADFGTVANALSNVHLLKKFADNRYYLLGQRYITTTNSAVYFLALSGGVKASLYEVLRDNDPKPHEISAFPPSFRDVPTIQTEMRGPSAIKPLFAEIESLKMPAGIFGQGELLFILTRTPQPSGMSQWQITRVDPVRLTVSRPYTLPTTADFLLVQPTDKKWIFVEKGRVEGFGLQDIQSILTIPTEWLTDEVSPLVQGGSVICTPHTNN